MLADAEGEGFTKMVLAQPARGLLKQKKAGAAI